jgi:hypothetical protein
MVGLITFVISIVSLAKVIAPVTVQIDTLTSCFAIGAGINMHIFPLMMVFTLV